MLLPFQNPENQDILVKAEDVQSVAPLPWPGFCRLRIGTIGVTVKGDARETAARIQATRKKGEPVCEFLGDEEGEETVYVVFPPLLTEEADAPWEPESGHTFTPPLPEEADAPPDNSLLTGMQEPAEHSENTEHGSKKRKRKRNKPTWDSN